MKRRFDKRYWSNDHADEEFNRRLKKGICISRMHPPHDSSLIFYPCSRKVEKNAGCGVCLKCQAEEEERQSEIESRAAAREEYMRYGDD